MVFCSLNTLHWNKKRPKMHQMCISQRWLNYFQIITSNSFSTSNWGLYVRSQPPSPSTPCILEMLWSNILPGSSPPTPGSTLLVSLRTCDSILSRLQVKYTDPTYMEDHGTPLSVNVLRKEAFSPVILESSGASWCERGVKRAVCV